MKKDRDNILNIVEQGGPSRGQFPGLTQCKLEQLEKLIEAARREGRDGAGTFTDNSTINYDLSKPDAGNCLVDTKE